MNSVSIPDGRFQFSVHAKRLYLNERRELGLSKTECNGVQEIREDGRDKFTTLLDQLGNQVTYEQSSGLCL